MSQQRAPGRACYSRDVVSHGQRARAGIQWGLVARSLRRSRKAGRVFAAGFSPEQASRHTRLSWGWPPGLGDQARAVRVLKVLVFLERNRGVSWRWEDPSRSLCLPPLRRLFPHLPTPPVSRSFSQTTSHFARGPAGRSECLEHLTDRLSKADLVASGPWASAHVPGFSELQELANV